MIGTLGDLGAAMAVFVGGHFILSSLSVRRPIIRKLGENGFRGGYSIAMLLALVWVVFAYRAAPTVALYAPPAELRWVAIAIMPVASILLVAAATGRNVTAVGGEAQIAPGETYAPQGIFTVTRHPMLWAFALWGVSHLLVRGDMASILLFGGMTVLSLGGMAHIDRRRAATLGPDWGPVALNTSAVPFRAAVEGRVKVDWAGIGLGRVAGGLALYAVMVVAHPWLGGVALAPALAF